jgi:hypothetical protein
MGFAALSKSMIILSKHVGMFLAPDGKTVYLYHFCNAGVYKENGVYGIMGGHWGSIYRGKCGGCGEVISGKDKFLLNLVGR